MYFQMHGTFEAIKTRRSTKSFDKNHTMTKDDIDSLLELAILSPTSYNVQNWRFVIVTERQVSTQAVSWPTAAVWHRQDACGKDSGCIISIKTKRRATPDSTNLFWLWVQRTRQKGKHYTGTPDSTNLFWLWVRHVCHQACKYSTASVYLFATSTSGADQ